MSQEINVVLYGAPSSNYQYLKHSLLEEASRLGITIRLQEICNATAFIALDLQRVPVVEIDNKIIPRGREHVNDYLQAVYAEMYRFQQGAHM